MIVQYGFDGEPRRHKDGPQLRQRVVVKVGGSAWMLWCKGTWEYLLALGLLIVSAPVMMIAVIAVRLTSRGPVLYSQTRVRPAREALHHLEDPHDDQQLRGDHRRALVPAWRRADHARGLAPPPHPHRRAAAALECAARRDVPRRPTPRAA